MSVCAQTANGAAAAQAAAAITAEVGGTGGADEEEDFAGRHRTRGTLDAGRWRGGRGLSGRRRCGRSGWRGGRCGRRDRREHLLAAGREVRRVLTQTLELPAGAAL